MCFVPKVSLTTAVIEFLVAFWLYRNFPKKTLTNFFVIILFLLGLYQLTEFMLCVFGQPEIWGKIGFISYTLIPAVTVYFSLIYINLKPSIWIILIWPLFFIIFALLDTNFILQGTCSTLFVTIRNKFTFPNSSLFPFPVYSLYYFSHMAIAFAAAIIGGFKTKDKKKKRIFWLMLVSIILTLFPPLLLIIIFPALGIQFPSVYCHFAMILALTAIIWSYLDK